MQQSHGAFEFHLDTRSGIPAYLQLVQQVRRAILLGVLHPGDRLPSVREVVEALVISPNTVLKAYRDLELTGLTSSRPGVGSFVLPSVNVKALTGHERLVRQLQEWFRAAQEAQLSTDEIDALIAYARRTHAASGGAA